MKNNSLDFDRENQYCIAHIANLAMQDSLKKLLIEILIVVLIDVAIIDVLMRWNSIIDILECELLLRSALNT